MRPSTECGGGGGPPATITYTWILSDQIGSGIIELNDTGNATRQVVFEPFGQKRREREVREDNAVNDYFAGHPKQAASSGIGRCSKIFARSVPM